MTKTVEYGAMEQTKETNYPTENETLDFKRNFEGHNLDESQREVVVFALQEREIAVIHGPPGTGKTTTVVEVVACAPSNVAVENLVEKLTTSNGIQMIRIGHPDRLLPQIKKFSLDGQIAASDAGRLLQDVRRKIDETLARK
ncbi:DNA-binding protein SMUBP-2 [Holothuria leucospilota]|uniref:DNA-binding protein SMUBP-2 n=1 Tax=Holothuria leucospilota TaxID=206669 RepID=A0A9Q1H4X7_HOLLE|nr:DNA-binding protein SMUBP-2 [Holothuria leucospilota]